MRTARFRYLATTFLAVLTACGDKEEPPAKAAVSYTVSTLMGGDAPGLINGPATASRLFRPVGIAVDGQGSVYVADAGNSCIRKMTSSGTVSTFVDRYPATQMQGPLALALDATGVLYVSDESGHRIYKVLPSGIVSLFAGSPCVCSGGFQDGPAMLAHFNRPYGVAADNQGNVYVADSGNNRIRKITQAGVVSTFAGGAAGYVDGPLATAQFSSPCGVAVDAQGAVYVADTGNNCIRKITAAGVVSTIAGSTTAGASDGIGVVARFSHPYFLAVDKQGVLFVTDSNNQCIRQVDAAGQVTTLAGVAHATGFLDGKATVAKFSSPLGIAVAPQGTTLYVADSYNNRIRTITQD